jgi:hypothetical protein
VKRILIPTLFLTSLSAVVFSQTAPPKPKPATQAANAVQPKPATATATASKAAADSKKIEALTAELQKLKTDQAKEKQEQEKILKAQQLVQEWFRRWNALEEGTPEAREKFLELYAPHALHITGPSEKQIGVVMYQGREEIERLAEMLPKKYNRVAFYIKVRTVQEKTSDLLSASMTPAGQVVVAAEFGGSFGMKDTNKRFMVPGTAFFDIQDGKIERARIYYARGEDSEVIGSYDSGV